MGISSSDPFEHHPELRDKIVDPEASFFRTLTTDMIRGVMAQHGVSDLNGSLIVFFRSIVSFECIEH